MYKFKVSNSDTGCNQLGVVLVCDKSTGYFMEISSPWNTVRIGWIYNVL